MSNIEDVEFQGTAVFELVYDAHANMPPLQTHNLDSLLLQIVYVH